MVYEIEEDEPVSIAVVLAVSSVKECDPTELPPLHEAINPDALAQVFDSGPDSEVGVGTEVTFTYSDYQVTVTDGEYITLQPMHSPAQ